MQYTCSICCEIFTLTSQLSVVQCGHVYHTLCVSEWLKDHSTCPQCRAKLREQPHRVYLNIDDNGEEDPSSLLHKINQLSFHLEEEKRSKSVILKERDAVNEQNTKLLGKIMELERETRDLTSAVKVKDIKIAELNALQHNLEEKENALADLKGVETVLHGTKEEVRLLLARTARTPQSFRNLCTYIEVLKKQLTDKNNRLKEEKARNKEAIDQVSYLKRKSHAESGVIGASDARKQYKQQRLSQRESEPFSASSVFGTDSIKFKQVLRDSETNPSVTVPKKINATRSILSKNHPSSSKTGNTVFTGMGGSSRPPLAGTSGICNSKQTNG